MDVISERWRADMDYPPYPVDYVDLSYRLGFWVGYVYRYDPERKPIAGDGKHLFYLNKTAYSTDFSATMLNRFIRAAKPIVELPIDWKPEYGITTYAEDYRIDEHDDNYGFRVYPVDWWDLVQERTPEPEENIHDKRN